MTTDDREQRITRLAEAAAARTADATARARRAITKLNHSGQPITFVSVARTAGVSTSFLYQHTALRREVGEHRRRAPNPHTPNAAATTVESLRTEFAAAVQRNRDLTEEIAVLRTENEALRSRPLEQRCGPTQSAAPSS